MTTSGLSWRDPDVLWASLLGVGFAPRAPGTWGTFAAAVLWWYLLAPLAWWIQVAVIVVYFVTGWWASERITKRYGVSDAPEIVADEVAGMWLALLFAPQSVLWVGIGILVFRMLDIAKPGPIGWLDHNLKGGLGVMLDDMLAGLLVCALLAWLPGVMGIA